MSTYILTHVMTCESCGYVNYTTFKSGAMLPKNLSWMCRNMFCRETHTYPREKAIEEYYERNRLSRT